MRWSGIPMGRQPPSERYLKQKPGTLDLMYEAQTFIRNRVASGFLNAFRNDLVDHGICDREQLGQVLSPSFARNLEILFPGLLVDFLAERAP
jgi:hypothetical protein